MERITRQLDQWPCRARKCKVQEWFENLFGDGDDYTEMACDGCPFEEVYARCGAYEDMLEKEGVFDE